MRVILQDNNRYILHFDRYEEVIAELVEFCKSKNIGSAEFRGLGAAQEVTLSWYDVDAKTYWDKEINEKVEIVSLSGNIARMKDEIIVHAHGAFSDRDFRTQGGHVKKLVVGAVCEIVLEAFAGAIEREADKETGLNVLK